MKGRIIIILLQSVFLPFLLIGQNNQLIQKDFIGNSHYSFYNFTDLDTTYRGVDSWIYFKTTFWLNKRKWLGFYSALEASHMFYPNQDSGKSPFHWQRYTQTTIGFQWHPFFDGRKDGERIFPINWPLNGIRLFLEGGYRWYYDKPLQRASTPYSNYIEKDFRVGIDYYFDNLYGTFLNDIFAVFAWTSASFRATNYASEKYNGLFITSSIKAGIQHIAIYPNNPFQSTKTTKDKKAGTLVAYGLFNMAHSPRCLCRWWENYLRWGGGVSLYPFTYNRKRKPNDDRINRFHFYFDFERKLGWFGEGPRVQNVLYPPNRWDIKFGIGFSTPGFIRNNH